MLMLERADTEIVGRVAYVDPMKEWGYLHGPHGERVYFHASCMPGGLAGLELGATVCYSLAEGGDQLCATRVVRCMGRDR
jgi:cold shock CspA family protein